MIIFDLDTLADDTHRRHFIDPRDMHRWVNTPTNDEYYTKSLMGERVEWKPNIAAYNAACGNDVPIIPVIDLFKLLGDENKVQIWSCRCESTRHNSEIWLWDHAGCGFDSTLTYPQILKMRPIGNTEPACILKEKWLDEMMIKRATTDGVNFSPDPSKYIDFVFDLDPQSISMWRRQGIFCFDCR